MSYSWTNNRMSPFPSHTILFQSHLLFSFMGGNSTKATSGINGAGTTSQQDLDIKDSAKVFFEDTKKSVSINYTYHKFVFSSFFHFSYRQKTLLVTTSSASSPVAPATPSTGSSTNSVSTYQRSPASVATLNPALTAAGLNSPAWSSHTLNWSVSKISQAPLRTASKSTRKPASPS